jgi:hypothetical protein
MKQNSPSIRQPEHPVLFGAIGFIFASLLIAVIIIAVFFPLGLFGIAPPEGLRKYMIVILLAPLAEEIIRYKILADAPDPMKARYSPWRLAVLMAAGWIMTEIAAELVFGADITSRTSLFGVPFLGIIQAPLLSVSVFVLMAILIFHRRRWWLVIGVGCFLHAIFNAIGIFEQHLSKEVYIQDGLTVVMVVGLIWVRYWGPALLPHHAPSSPEDESKPGPMQS